MYKITFKKKNDYTSNTLKLSFPDGLDVEVINLNTLKNLKNFLKVKFIIKNM
jgi:spore coat polysaccharide biosynthesis protein SpsF (cytidylyltransferase family)